MWDEVKALSIDEFCGSIIEIYVWKSFSVTVVFLNGIFFFIINVEKHLMVIFIEEMLIVSKVLLIMCLNLDIICALHLLYI